jgi:NADH-quinone oxidoreductase subunit G
MADYKLTQTEPSLNPPASDLVNIKINGIALQVPKNENIIESAKRLGIDIPFFCYHPRLSKGDAANCRMCLVETGMTGPDGSVRMMPKPQTACTLPAAEGMVILTDSEKIVKDRRGVLEFLLINHPLDCPICDRGGECPLQNNTLFYGPPTSRYIEEKRHFPKAYPLSDYVVFDRERCIHCARCTRFTEDISGDSQLGFFKRGADMEVATFAHTAYTSKFSGNVIELCPVGALLSRTYRFKARPWDLHTQRSICSKCSNGCNIKIDYRLEQLQRVNARVNEDVNEEWTCDKGKFGHDYVSSEDRLKTPMLKRNGEWVPIGWEEAYSLLTEKLRAAGSNVGGIGGQRCTNEDDYLFQKLFREILKSNNLDSRLGRYQGPTNKPLFARFGYHAMGDTIADLETKKSIFVIGSELVDEQPILFLRVRKAWRYHSAHVISAVNRVPEDTTRVGDFAAVEMVYRPGTEIALLNGLLNVMFANNLLPEKPAVDLSGLKQSVSEWTPEKTEQETGVSAVDLGVAARLLVKGPMTILAGKAVAEHPYYEEVVAALGNLVVATGNSGSLNIPGLECNTQGAMDMGILPDSGPGYAPIDKPGLTTQQMLEAAAGGKLQALWIVGAKLIENYPDSDLARRALENCPFVVVNELTMTETARAADLVLPVASVAEKDGTYTNCERRVQRIYKAFEISRDVKPDWLVFSEVTAQLGGGTPYFSARDVLRDIAANVPIYAAISPKSLGETGVRWNYPATEPRPASIAPVRYTAPARDKAAAQGG